MFKRKVSLSCLVLTTVLLVGCGEQDDISQLNNLQSLNTGSSVTNDYSLSWTEEQDLVYAQVSDRSLLDLSALEKCSDNDAQLVINYMNKVDDQLVGVADPKDWVLNSCFSDYLLAMFEQTPYYWQRTKTTIRGVDGASRSIIVDVDYKTIDFQKAIKGDSTIVKGDPNYESLMQTRYKRYTNILTQKYQSGTDEWVADMEKFIQVYGEPSEIYKTQQNTSLTQLIRETHNQTTYNGLVDNDGEKTPAEMSVRFVLVPKFALGINMYVLNYKVGSDITEGKSVFTDEGYDTVVDNVYAVLYSYFNCIDESDFYGLYKLSTNFARLDKYYNDMFKTTYNKHENFTLSVFSIEGTHITCGVTVASKSRAIGSYMTYPIYTDRYYVELDLVDDQLKVSNIELLSRIIEGEPSIISGEADIDGFVSEIKISNEDKQAIEKLICNFGALQLTGENCVNSEDFSKYVDISMETGALNTLKENVTSLSGDKKVVWLENYTQGTPNYASVRCKENFKQTGGVVEANVTYDFIYKGDKWYVNKYDINSSTRLDTEDLTTSGCLCLLAPNNVESYTSQVQGTSSAVKSDASDNSIVIEHEEYMPSVDGSLGELNLLDLEIEGDDGSLDISGLSDLLGDSSEESTEENTESSEGESSNESSESSSESSSSESSDSSSSDSSSDTTGSTGRTINAHAND